MNNIIHLLQIDCLDGAVLLKLLELDPALGTLSFASFHTIMKARETWCTTVLGVPKSWTQASY